jgi:hypothetical protein
LIPTIPAPLQVPRLLSHVEVQVSPGAAACSPDATPANPTRNKAETVKTVTNAKKCMLMEATTRITRPSYGTRNTSAWRAIFTKPASTHAHTAQLNARKTYTRNSAKRVLKRAGT